jgi:5'-phosphate synthase pdxT subunit
MTTVGVLALQGDFREHSVSLRRVGADALEVRRADQLARCNALIIPGGESTTIARLLLSFELFEPIQKLGRDGFPIWGTCAGAILLADDVRGELDRPPLGLLPIVIDRNAYGRQVDSFETELDASALPLADGTEAAPPFHAVFIRAPRIRSLADDVEVVMTLPANGDEAPEPVAVRRGVLLATTFHPELTDDARLHAYFVERCVAPARGESVLASDTAAGAAGGAS